MAANRFDEFGRPLVLAEGYDRHYRRSGDDYAACFTAMLPQGQAWPRDPGSTMVLVCDGLSQYWGFVDGRAADLLEIESDPRTTVELLPDWERAWGLPDPCFAEPKTIADRQKILVLWMTFMGGQSRKFFEDLATFLGYEIHIKEHAPWMFGVSEVGLTDDLPQIDGKVGHWTMDGDSINWYTNQISDMSASGNDGTLFGLSSSDQVHGKYGEALRFNTSAIDFGNVLHLAEFSYSAWIYLTEITDRALIMGRYGETWFGLVNGTLRLWLGDDSQGIGVDASTPLLLNTWHHVAAIYDGGLTPGSAKLYVDGARVDRVQRPSDLYPGMVDLGVSFRIGKEPDLAPFHGRIDEVRVYDKVLSDADVIHLRGNNWRWEIGPPELRFYWSALAHVRDLTWWRYGEAIIGVDPHLRIGLAKELQCLMQRWKPAHTELVYDFFGGDMSGVVPPEDQLGPSGLSMTQKLYVMRDEANPTDREG